MKIKDRLHIGPVSVRRSAIHGYGVFADQPINKGDIVEECHVLTTKETLSCFGNYLFEAGQITILPLGLGSIYNHSKDCNLSCGFDPAFSVLRFKALKDIRADEELCIDYGNDWFGSRQLQLIEPFRYRHRHFYALMKRLWRFGLIVGSMMSLLYFSNLILGK